LLRHGQSRTLAPGKGRDPSSIMAYFTVMVSRDQTPLKHTSFLNGGWSSREGLSTSTRPKSSKRCKTALIWSDGRCEFGSNDGPSLLKTRRQVNFAAHLAYPYFTHKRPVTGTRLGLNPYHHRNVRVRTKLTDGTGT
jgi:hypothetical protein